MNKTKLHQWNILFIAWLVVFISALGSIFFSEILKYPPCVLCWYQRICLFPLVPMLLLGLFPYDRSVVKFALPLSLTGWWIAFYHNLLYTGIIPKSLQPCDQSNSCTEVHLGLFGFVTIPLLSLLSFTLLNILLFLLIKRPKHEK